MLKDILISMIIWVVVGCGNGSGVKRLDTRAVEKDTVLKWSQLVFRARYKLLFILALLSPLISFTSSASSPSRSHNVKINFCLGVNS